MSCDVSDSDDPGDSSAHRSTSLILHLRLSPPALEPEHSGGSRSRQGSGSLLDEVRMGFCSRITPRWKVGDGGLFLDLGGMERLYGPCADGAADICRQAQSEFPVWSAGLSSSLLASKLASLVGGSLRDHCLFIVPPGDGPSFLSGFSVRVLDCDRRDISKLHSLGVRTLGDLEGIPSSLLVAVFGDAVPCMTPEIRGWPSETRTGDHTKPVPILVASVCFAAPMVSPAGEGALRQGLAMRALSRGLGDGQWSLTVDWASGSRATVSYSGPATESWPSWLELMEVLWSRLPSHRQGIRRLELRFLGLPGSCFQQMDLFANPADSPVLSKTIARIREKFDSSFSSASEILLREWGACWESNS